MAESKTTEERIIQLITDGRNTENEILSGMDIDKKELKHILRNMKDRGEILIKSDKKIKHFYLNTDEKQQKKEFNDKKNNFSKIYEYKYLLIVLTIQLIIILSSNGLDIRQFQGPLYGGDVYWHYAETLNIYEGNLPWKNPQIIGDEYAYYGWLLQFVLAILAKITLTDLKILWMYSPIFLGIISIIVLYFLGLEVFKNHKFAFFTAILGVGVYYGGHPQHAAFSILGPLFFLFFIKAVNSGRMLYKCLTGLAYGAASLSHVAAFPSLSIFLFVFFAYASIIKFIKFEFVPGQKTKLYINSEDSKAAIKKNIMFLLPIILIGGLIAIIFFAPIIFVYHGSTPNPVNEFTQADMSKYGQKVVFDLLSGTFFNVNALFGGDMLMFLYSVIVSVGVYFIVKSRNEVNGNIILIMIFSALVALFHSFITIPLLGKELITGYLFSFIMGPATKLLFVCGVFGLYHKLTEHGIKNIFLIIIFIFLIAISFNSYNSVVKDDRWFNLGKSEQNEAINSIESWVINDTGLNDVFLSTEELSFALNGLSARKVVITRRTHFSPYVNINDRIADASIILYGNDSKKSLDLLKKYNVKYLYWDANWMSFAYREPTMTSPDYSGYLSQYDVKFQPIHTYLNPAWSEMNPQYDMLAILPATQNPYEPWSNQLTRYLEEVKVFTINGQIYAKIYMIKYPQE